ncbi:hypothetical protein B1R38_27035 [Bacillus cereus]|uniref:hypothetical protein n=1 Tax=Bacillus cereus TaxID=1396 RepID=UPI000D64FCBE|nr:hypothetical protein [Bacillus cereus]PWE70244.1 hypothetical protein B1R38_27035 [Bacillus cereus]
MDYSQRSICDLLMQNTFKFEIEDEISKKYVYKDVLTFYVGKEGWSAYGKDGRDFEGINSQTTRIGLLISEYRELEKNNFI